MPVQPPVIVVPGITATSLEDAYPLVPEEVWSAVIHKEYERIALHPDDIRYEAIEPARVQPRALFGIVYEDLILALRHDLSRKADRPTPVFGFPYDWRQTCARSADQLGQFIDEVLARTRLVPHYRGQTVDRVDLVGHSMGGVIIADYLARSGKSTRVRRVATLGTPFRGAIDAILKLTTGMGTLTGDRPRDRERETARMTPALYQLLPTYDGAVLPDEGLSGDIFKVDTWQPSVIKTMEEYIKMIKADADAATLFKSHLKGAQDLRKRTEELSLTGKLPDGEDGWLPIVGLGAPTQVEIRIERWKGEPWFTMLENRNDGSKTGDGTVPFLGACPGFLERNRLVGVTPEDFSFWELKDRALAKVSGFHGVLPTVNLVQRLVLRHLRDDYSGDVWGRPVPGVLKPSWPSWLKPPK
jgi:pimeloyl-ACP methyl ester carboxylesterase